MALPAGTYTITSLLQGNGPLGVSPGGSASQPIVSGASESKFTISPAGDGTYKLSIGAYPSVAALSHGFMESSVAATADSGVSTVWRIVETSGRYSISTQDSLGTVAWTIGTEMEAGEPLRPVIQSAQPRKNQLFHIVPA